MLETLLGCSDVDGSLQLLLTVVIIVHQFAVPQYKPAHFPVSEEEGDTMKIKAKIIYSMHNDELDLHIFYLEYKVK